MSQKLQSVNDVDRDKFPHYWTELEGNCHVEDSHIGGEHISDGEAPVYVGAGFSREHVNVSVGYSDEPFSVGALGKLTPEQAREMARSLERAAEIAEDT